MGQATAEMPALLTRGKAIARATSRLACRLVQAEHRDGIVLVGLDHTKTTSENQRFLNLEIDSFHPLVATKNVGVGRRPVCKLYMIA